MATLTWIGGGTNNVRNAADWSSGTVPTTGDTLVINSGIANARGSILAGDTVVLGVDRGEVAPVPPGPILNLSGHTSMAEVATYSGEDATLNVTGVATIATLASVAGRAEGAYLTVNVGAHSTLAANVEAFQNGELTVNALAPSAKLVDNGANTIQNDFATITPNLIGTATWTIGGDYGGAEFGGAVASGQSFTLLGAVPRLTIDQPAKFHGSVDISVGIGDTVNLAGISDATSYSFKDDLLKLYNGGKVIDTLKLTAPTGGFQVGQGASGVQIELGGITPGNGFAVLPQHAASGCT